MAERTRGVRERLAFWRRLRPGARRILKWSAVAAGAAGVGIGGFLYWQHALHHPSTDDAYVHAHVVQVAAQVTGQVESVPVSDQQAVAADQTLFALDPRPFQYAVEQARAERALAHQTMEAEQAAVAAAEAEVSDRRVQVENARTHFDRTRSLADRSIASRSDLDDARARLDRARADLRLARARRHQVQVELGPSGAANHRVQRAQAALDRARLDLEHARVDAACDGRISGLTLRPGDTVRAEEPQFALVCQQRFWVFANLKETDLARVRPGQVATLHMDLYPDETFHGIVEEIDPASGAAFSLLPPENATGNWVKVTQRVPVKILVVDATDRTPLRVQTSAEVTIDTGPDATPLGRSRGEGLSDDEAMARARSVGLVEAQDETIAAER
ncbi:MAG: HlyD family secretion protein [Myxococcota bacterium]